MRRAALLLAVALGAQAAEKPAEKPVLAILDFECAADPDLGAKVAERLEKRALQANKHILPDRDDLRLAVRQARLKIALNGAEKQLQKFAHDDLGAHILLWGTVEPRPDRAFLVSVRAMKSEGEPVPYMAVERECANFAALANFYTDFEPVLLEERTALRVLTPVSPEARARNLVKNWSFEEGTWFPAGWSKVDGLTSFWVDREDGKGKCVMHDTEVLTSQAYPWWETFKQGKVTAKDAPKKLPVGPGEIYATVGGWEGVQYYSDLIPVKPKMRYRISVDIKANWGGIFFPKAWVKGYGERTDDFTTQKRELYNAYLALRTETRGKEWETFTRTFNPTLKTPAVKWMGVMLYSYWPLGKYYWDNVIITEEAIED
ncbi:MAG TPA: hypothetical protein PLE19_02125 [Planctomycetota bacterium]|nr:hypothetical protein [Planctomycetota bacterium]HRR78639.1 hypothetical protein [Planctomycetota bacterium]HRT96910.1 hypothetical protein [Planctomycetota bacterium]